MVQSTGDLSLAPIDEDDGGDLREAAFAGRGCCGFLDFSCWERITTSAAEKEGLDRSWWRRGIRTLKKVKEWSDIVARPKLKTFIRHFNRAGGGRIRPGKFHYDPLSYSLNFDDGQGQNGHLDISWDFSSRYAAIPVGQSKDAT